MFLSIALVSFVFERIYNKGGEGRLRIDRFILSVPVSATSAQGRGLPSRGPSRPCSRVASPPSRASRSPRPSSKTASPTPPDITERVVEGTDVSPLKQTGVFPTVGYG